MKLKNLITLIQTDIIDSQWEAYKYSEKLKKEQAKGSLFPIPVARATDFQLTVQFAFKGRNEFDKKAVFSQPKFLFMLRNYAVNWYRNGLKDFVEKKSQAEDSVVSTSQDEAAKWKKAKETLLKISDLQRVSISKALNKLNANFDLIMSSEHKLNRKEFKKVFVETYGNYLAKHFELKSISLEDEDKNTILKKFEEVINADLDAIDKRNEEFVEEVETISSPIIVDSETLEKLPSEVIQKAVVNIKLDDIDDLDD